MDRVHLILTKPIVERCSQLRELFDDKNVKELSSVFVTVVESLFGVRSNLPATPEGWGLLKVTDRYHADECNALKKFLSVEQSLFRVITKLSHDSTALFQFPLIFLPAHSQRLLNEGVQVPLHSPSVVTDPQGQIYPVLYLNAFEFYMYHFVFHLVNRKEQKFQISSSNVDTTAYGALLQEYLYHFLPLSERCKPPPELILGLPKTPPRTDLPISSLTKPSSAAKSPYMAEYSSPAVGNGLRGSYIGPGTGVSPAGAMYSSPMSPPQMFTSRFFSPASYSSPAVSRSPWPQSLDSPTRRDIKLPYDGRDLPVRHDYLDLQIGTSYTFLQILVEFWLNIATPERESVQTYYQPSMEHVQCVRMFVKHVHYFTNNAVTLTDKQSLADGKLVTLPWEEFRRSAWDQLIQRKLYVFVKHCFTHWPADHTFRNVTELWLCCIQPWLFDKLVDDKEKDSLYVGSSWLPFIEANFLFYVQFFHSFMARAPLMELTAERTITMFRRVIKAFRQKRVEELLRSVEEKIPVAMTQSSRASPASPTSAYSADMRLHHRATPTSHVTRAYIDTSAYLGQSAGRHLMQMTTPLVQRFLDLEGPDFVYRPMFDYSSVFLVENLVNQLNAAVAKLKGRDAGYDVSLVGGLINVSGSPTFSRTTESLQVELNRCIDQFCEIFQIERPAPVELAASAASPRSPASQLPETSCVGDRLELTPTGRYEMINGMKKFQIDYQGDPELQPIRSFEWSWLVRSLYAFTSWINTKYADQLSRLPERKDFLSRVTLELLESTRTTYVIKNTSVLPPAIRQRREAFKSPRLSLRFLANKPTTYCICVVVLVCYVFLGLNPVYLALIVFALFVTYTAAKVALRAQAR